MTMAARREKRKLAKNPPVTKYNLDPTTPVHRQSLATTAPAPAMVEARQPAVTPQLRYAIPDQPQRSELSMNRNKSEHKGQSDWMVPFCHHPEGDHTTALEGLFVPCLLYGKTHWRLKNVALGRDPHNFKSSDGCNSMCWIHGALTAACCLSIGLTLIQRARIRAQYRILGSMGNDVIKSCFCGPCVMMQHDREVRVREGASGLARFPNEAQMSRIQPKLSQPMRYTSQKAPSAENPGIESRIFNQGRRFTNSELQEVPAVALSASEHSCRGSDYQSTAQHCEMEELKDHMLMEPHRRAINSRNAGAAVDGTTSSKQKTRVSSERLSLGSIASCSTFVIEPDSPTPSLHGSYLRVKGCEKLSRMPARGNLSYVHDFSDYSATKIVLDHYAKEERRLQEKGSVCCPVHFGEDKENLLLPALDDLAVPSTTSSGLSTVRQHTFKDDVAEMPLSELANPRRIDSCAESVDSAWLLDIPIQHRITSCSIMPRNPSSIQRSIRQHRIASCPATPGTPVIRTPGSSAEKNRMLSCTVETAPPSSSPSPVMQNNHSTSIMDIVDDSKLSTPLIQYSQYGHLLDESTLESGSPISRLSSKSRAFSCTALNPVASREQHSLESCSALSGGCSPVTTRQHRISSCCASIPSGSINQSNGVGSHRLEDCSFTTGSSTPILSKPYRFASYAADSPQSSRKSSAVMAHLMEDGCLLSGVASPVKQHRIASCGGNAGSGNSANSKNENGYVTSGSSTPNPRQHRAVSCIASSAISECNEHLLDDCDYDSKISSPLLQHNEIDCDVTSVSGEEQGHLLAVLEEEQEHLLEDCAADSGPSTPLRQHRISSCVVSSPSSNRTSVVKQHRASSCPSIIPAEGSQPNSTSHDSLQLPGGLLVDTSDNDQSTHTNYEDCLHSLDDCIAPADRARMEASASRDTEYERYTTRIARHFNDQSSEFNEKSTVGKEGSRRPRLNDFASHESDARFTLAQVLSEDQENPFIGVTPINGDGTMSMASRKGSVAPPAPFPSPAAPYPSPITPLHISGAYPPSITPSSLRKEKRRFPSEQSSAGSGFASYFGFGSSKKTSSGLIDDVGGNTGRGVESGNASRVWSMGLGAVEQVSVEELELEEFLS